ncbi:cytochrome P450 [Dendrothele bispora CBS 962.96]|uniref:Cytochrome P450 n=1 Tax=Dendrothele bispora (strain CBS 962.96) TaxID=1314807 RepID=A0A4S8M672_DENBC|nr:cytochrome P450 [Dendrothele bispora CBS 962.96]
MISSTAQYLPVVVAFIVLWYLSARKQLKSNLANVPGPKPSSWLKGHLKELLDPHEATGFHQMLLDQYGPVVRLNSKMGEHQLYTFDPKAMHHVLVKDQESFTRFNMTLVQLLFGDGLLSVTGDRHRKQKKSLSPVFSIAHMREMLPLFYEVVDKLQYSLREKVASGPQEIDMLAWMSRTALELIGESGLGYSFDPMTSEAAEHTYSKTIKNLVPAMARLPALRFFFLRWGIKIGTPQFRRSMLKLVPIQSVHELQDMADYMWSLSEEIYKSKKRALAQGDETVVQQIGRGKDIMSILMRGNLNAAEDNSTKGKSLRRTLIFAAMDTTSNALSRVLELLSAHPEVQTKLRQELVDARNDNAELSYDTLVELPYLDAVCRETLRLFPSVPMLSRISTRDVVVPLSKPVTGADGRKISELALPKDTLVFIGSINSNRDPELWGPDAHEFKPERWLSPLPQAIVDAHLPGVYSNLMTFGAGVRSCIGFKFSQLEMKAVLAGLVSTFKFSLAKDKKISWLMGGIITPFVEGDSAHPRLPLMVSLAEQSKESSLGK